MKRTGRTLECLPTKRVVAFGETKPASRIAMGGDAIFCEFGGDVVVLGNVWPQHAMSPRQVLRVAGQSSWKCF
jgi:hypothetical protein